MARVLVVQPDPSCPPALFGDWLQEAGCRLDLRHPYRGDEQPPARGYDGLLVLGGPMDADDDPGNPWLAVTRERIRDAALLGLPTLGICLGFQLAALALGGRVGRRPGRPSIGLLEVGWGCEVLLDPLVDRIAGDGRAVHWNQDVVTTLPPGAEVLARDADGAVQVARLAPTVWGVQFHPEADAALVAAWAEADAADTHSDGTGTDTDNTDRRLLPGVGLTGDAVVSQTSAALAELTDAWRPLAVSFARMVRGRAAANGTLWE